MITPNEDKHTYIEPLKEMTIEEGTKFSQILGDKIQNLKAKIEQLIDENTTDEEKELLQHLSYKVKADKRIHYAIGQSFIFNEEYQ